MGNKDVYGSLVRLAATSTGGFLYEIIDVSFLRVPLLALVTEAVEYLA